jgi:hypothetical protein
MKNSFYTSEEAANKALKWCNSRPTWMRICDINNTAHLYKKWKEIPLLEQKTWVERYKVCAQEAWEEFAVKPCRVDFGFISGEGVFYSCINEVPLMHNIMMVFRVGKEFKSNNKINLIRPKPN